MKETDQKEDIYILRSLYLSWFFLVQDQLALSGRVWCASRMKVLGLGSGACAGHHCSAAIRGTGADHLSHIYGRLFDVNETNPG